MTTLNMGQPPLWADTAQNEQQELGPVPPARNGAPNEAARPAPGRGRRAPWCVRAGAGRGVGGTPLPG